MKYWKMCVQVIQNVVLSLFCKEVLDKNTETNSLPEDIKSYILSQTWCHEAN